ncbi:MAG: tetratricopeptide repeat protein [Bryobacteraceae bacterium]
MQAIARMLLLTVALGMLSLVFGQPAQPNWKDRAEFDLFDLISKDANAQTRLANLEKWKTQYPNTEFGSVRLQIFLVTYQQLNKPREATSTALEVLKADPNNRLALTAILQYIYQFQPPSADDFVHAEQAANQMVNNIDAIFAADKRPPEIKDADWPKLKNDMKVFSYRTLGWIAEQKKEYEKAEAAYTKSLELDPNAGQVSFWLGRVILAQRKPEKQVAALYHYARAASFDGTGALTAADRKSVKDYLSKVYKQYHGSEEGLDEFLAKAKGSAGPPSDLKIKTAREIMEDQMAKEADFAKNNPEIALWMSLKKELTGPDGQKYFDEKMKDSLLPKLKGKLVSSTPEVKPKELVLSILESTGDVTLKLDSALAGKMDAGSELSFEAVPKSFTKEPFMVLFEVEKAKVEGWKGAPAPAPAPKRAPVRKKK